MMEKDSKNLLTIGEIARFIGRGSQTIKHWYEWAEENDRLSELPNMYRVGSKGVRYFDENDVGKLIEFRDKISYGMMSDYNVKNWGKRGEQIQERKDS